MRRDATEQAIRDLLEGDEVDYLGFSANHVELSCIGGVLRLLRSPVRIVKETGDEIAFPEPGSRDALCELQGHTVKLVSLTASEMTLHFDDGTRLVGAIHEGPGTSIEYEPNDPRDGATQAL
jgi:hypothetical protein